MKECQTCQRSSAPILLTYVADSVFNNYVSDKALLYIVPHPVLKVRNKHACWLDQSQRDLFWLAEETKHCQHIKLKVFKTTELGKTYNAFLQRTS